MLFFLSILFGSSASLILLYDAKSHNDMRKRKLELIQRRLAGKEAAHFANEAIKKDCDDTYN